MDSTHFTQDRSFEAKPEDLHEREREHYQSRLARIIATYNFAVDVFHELG